jgi:hypothetical protein
MVSDKFDQWFKQDEYGPYGGTRQMYAGADAETARSLKERLSDLEYWMRAAYEAGYQQAARDTLANELDKEIFNEAQSVKDDSVTTCTSSRVGSHAQTPQQAFGEEHRQESYSTSWLHQESDRIWAEWPSFSAANNAEDDPRSF